jgi:hypothetical protein
MQRIIFFLIGNCIGVNVALSQTISVASPLHFAKRSSDSVVNFRCGNLAITGDCDVQVTDSIMNSWMHDSAGEILMTITSAYAKPIKILHCSLYNNRQTICGDELRRRHLLRSAIL